MALKFISTRDIVKIIHCKRAIKYKKSLWAETICCHDLVIRAPGNKSWVTSAHLIWPRHNKESSHRIMNWTSFHLWLNFFIPMCNKELNGTMARRFADWDALICLVSTIRDILIDKFIHYGIKWINSCPWQCANRWCGHRHWPSLSRNWSISGDQGQHRDQWSPLYSAVPL